MQKILVLVEIPSISKKFEVYLPVFLMIEEIIPLIIKAIKELSNEQYVSSGYEFLCLKEKSILLKGERKLESYDVKNGDHLILF